ncbi:MAG: tRNA guanosine(15) transglycosylase TgtA, partial [Halobacteriales archaeon]
MPPVFEQRAADGAARLGELAVPRADATVRTPALLPVVNPNVQRVDPSRLAGEFGAQALITNAYIIRESDDLRGPALDRGVHDLLGFDGPVMTDSGSFQLAEYGDVDVTTEEILAFQRDIGADIATPVDIPTPPDADRERAEADLEETLDRLEVAAAVDAGEMLLTGPVQGSTYPELRERAGREARAAGLDVYPVGAMVPLLTAYRFADVVDLVVAAKRGLGPDAPVHLFGAGHPMVFALAAALGCDLFDSAAYALYADDGRYLTVDGTEHLADLHDLPCACPVCTEWTAATLRDAPEAERRGALAEHNLHVSFAEMRRVRQAIRDGDLFELVEARARAHPAMLDGYRALLDHAGWLERFDPATKGTFFHVSAESARRPEVRRHRERLDRLDVPATLLLVEGDVEDAPVDPGVYDAVWALVPPFGPVPPALSESYPLSAEVPERVDAQSQVAAAEAVARLVEHRPDAGLTLVHRGWPDAALDRLPASVEV